MADESAPNAPIDQEVQQYAEQVKEDLNPTMGGLLGGILGGVRDMSNKVSALAAAARAGQFAVSPDKAEAMTKELNNILDVVTQMSENSNRIATKTPLGKGYADSIAEVNEGVGISAAEIFGKFAERVTSLRDSVQQSVANYQRVDSGNADGLKNT